MIFRQMKVISTSFAVLVLVFTAGFVERVAGISCGTCGACWKIDSPGIDIKMPCPKGECGDTCPSGYDRIHCAKTERCDCSRNHASCAELGPCVCGIDASGKKCKSMEPGGCPN